MPRRQVMSCCVSGQPQSSTVREELGNGKSKGGKAGKGKNNGSAQPPLPPPPPPPTFGNDKGKGKGKGKGEGEGKGKGKGTPMEPVAHPTLGMLQPGQKLMHPTRGLCTVESVEGYRTTVRQFLKNDKLATFTTSALLELPDPTVPIWELHTTTEGWQEFEPAQQPTLEQDYAARKVAIGECVGNGNPWQHVLYHSGNRWEVDFNEMVMTDARGRTRAVRRRLKGQAGAAQPLDIVEVELACRQQEKVQIKGKGLGRVLFVMDNNAKVLLDSPPEKKTFVALDLLYAIDANLEAEEALAEHRFNFGTAESLSLRGSASSVAEPIPLTRETAARYVADSARSIWQFKPGTMWSNFDNHSDDQLNGTFCSIALKKLGSNPVPALYSGAHNFSRRSELSSPLVFRPSPSAPLEVSVLELGQLRQPGALCWLREFAKVYVVGAHDHEHNNYWATHKAEAITHAAGFLSQLNNSFGLALTLVDCCDSSGATAGDLVLQIGGSALKNSHRSTYQDGSYAIDAPPFLSSTTRPIIVEAGSSQGIKEGLATLRRSFGFPAASSAVPSFSSLNGKDTTDCVEKGLALPSCFVLDAPTASGKTRWLTIATTTDLQSIHQFVRMAESARSYQPSHSRTVRRITTYFRSDGKRVQIRGRGLATLVCCSDDEIGVQFSQMDAVETVPLQSAAEPAIRTTGIEWSDCFFAERSGSGKSGVYFLEFPHNRAVVVKPTDEPACELAGYQIGLLLGIRMPALVGLNAAVGEGLQLVKKMKALERTGRLQNDKADASSLGTFAFMIVQEFQRGQTLKDICHRGGLQWAEKTFGPVGALSIDGKRRLQELGAIIAFDVIMHNSDRWYLEGIFNNFSRCGNMANIMFTEHGDPVAIDNTTTAYDATLLGNGDRFYTYLQSISDLVSRAKARTKDDANSGDDRVESGVALSRQPSAHLAIKGVRRFFLEGQGVPTESSYVPGLEYDIGEEGMREIERGFMRVVDHCKNRGNEFAKAIRRIELSIRRELGAELDESWLDLPRVRAEFFNEITGTLARTETAPLKSIDSKARALARTSSALAAAGVPHWMGGCEEPPAGWYRKRPAPATLNRGSPICEEGHPIAVHFFSSKKHYVRTAGINTVSKAVTGKRRYDETRPYIPGEGKPEGEGWVLQREDAGWWVGFITSTSSQFNASRDSADILSCTLATCRLSTPVGWRDFALGFEDLTHIRWAPSGEAGKGPHQQEELAAQHMLAYKIYRAVSGNGGTLASGIDVDSAFAYFDTADRGEVSRRELLEKLGPDVVSADELDSVLETLGARLVMTENQDERSEDLQFPNGCGNISFALFKEIFVARPSHQWQREGGKLIVPSPEGENMEAECEEAGALTDAQTIPWAKFMQSADRLAVGMRRRS